MPSPRVAGWLAAFAVLLTCGATACGAVTPAGSAQDYPRKPVRIVTVEPGGSGDFAARLVAQGLAGSLGQPVIVDNRGGANGVIAITTVSKALSDGYTLLIYNSGMWILPLMQSVPYDVARDFVPITLTVSFPNILVVHPSITAASVRELISLLKSRPGEFSYGSAGMGQSTHLAGELFKIMAGVNVTHVPYKGGGPALNDLIGAQVQLMFATAASVSPHVAAGRLRALGVTSLQPSPLLPGLPTVAASGLPGFESVSNQGILAPAGTSATIVRRLHEEIVRVLNTPDVRERFLKTGAEVVGSTPDQLAAAIKSDVTRMGKVITDARMRID